MASRVLTRALLAVLTPKSWCTQALQAQMPCVCTGDQVRERSATSVKRYLVHLTTIDSAGSIVRGLPGLAAAGLHTSISNRVYLAAWGSSDRLLYAGQRLKSTGTGLDSGCRMSHRQVAVTLEQYICQPTNHSI